MASRIPEGDKTGFEGSVPNNDSADALQQFGQCASALRDLLYNDGALNEEEFLFMDKHFQVLQMAYLRWKRVHKPTTDGLQH